MGKAIAFVDIQNDFIDGSLGVGYKNFVESWHNIENLLRSNKYDYFIATRDYHPANHYSFKEYGGQWPAHCVKTTQGADFYWKLNDIMGKSIIDSVYKTVITKGVEQTQEEYGVDVLQELPCEINSVTIVGLCTDYCVKSCAIETKKAHPEINVNVYLAGCCAITEETKLAAIEEMKAAGVNVI